MSTQVSLQNSAFGGVVTVGGKANFELPLAKILEDLFIVLSEKEKTVIIQRYSLDSQDKRTLESIGEKFGVTRERIRQIENIGLSKLRRVFQNTKLRLLSDFAKEYLKASGGVQREEELIEYIFNKIDNAEEVDRNIISLALKVDPELSKQEKSDQFYPFWRFIDINPKDIKDILQESVNLIRNKKDTIEEPLLISKIQDKLGIAPERTQMISSLLRVDKRLKLIQEGWGLMSMRWVNPKSIRDKALIVLRKENKPLHFKELADKIKDYHFDNKDVTTQAVHNELIRYDQFVLMGRGLYALREWGYDHGTVADIIKAILKKSGRPMTKQEIINDVLKQRKVKLGTISLNLQNTAIFKRLDRAVYTLQEGVI